LFNKGDSGEFTVVLDNTTGTADATASTFRHLFPEGCAITGFSIDDIPEDSVTREKLSSGVLIGTIGAGDSLTLKYTVLIDAIPSIPVFANQPSLEFEFPAGTGSAKIEIFYTAVQLEVNLPPQVPILLSPTDTEIVSRPVSLKWQKSTDPNGDPINYILYLDTDQVFGEGILIAAGSPMAERVTQAATLGVGVLLFLPLWSRMRRKKKRAILFLILISIVLSTCKINGNTDDLVLGVGESGYLADTLQAKTTYYWKVEAVDARGGRSSSEVKSFRTQ
jgi:hypothetical protein